MAATHKAEVVQIKQMANSVITVRSRCCADSSTDMCHTIYIHAGMDDAYIDNAIKQHNQKVEALHAAVVRTREIASKYMRKE